MATSNEGDTFGEGLAYGALGLGSSLGDVLDFFGAPEHGRAVRDFFEERRKKYSPAHSIQGNVVDNPELLGNLDWWSFNLGQIAPSIVASVVPGLGGAKVASMLGAGARGIQLAGAAGAGISGGLLEAAGAYREAKDRGFSDDEARKVFVGMGLGSAILNAIPAGAMLGKGGLLGRTVAAGLGEGVTEAAEEPLQAVLMGDPISEGLKQGATVFGPAMLTGFIGGGVGGAAAPRAPRVAAPITQGNVDGQEMQAEVQRQEAGQNADGLLIQPRAAQIAPPIVPTDAVNARQVESVAPPAMKVKRYGDVSFDKPQGLYTSPYEVDSPHKDLGEETIFQISNDAKILDITTTDANNLAMRKGAIGAGAGVAAVRHIDSGLFYRLKGLSKSELMLEAKKIDPTVDWSRYYDSQEIIEAIGGVLARRAGYDVIVSRDRTPFMGIEGDPNFDEVVILNKSVADTKIANSLPVESAQKTERDNGAVPPGIPPVPPVGGDGQKALPPGAQPEPWIPEPLKTFQRKTEAGPAVEEIAKQNRELLLSTARRTTPEDARRDIAVDEEARKLVADPAEVERLLNAKPGATRNDAETRALQFITDRDHVRLTELQNTLYEKIKLGTITDDDRLTFRRAVFDAQVSQAALSGASTELARARRQFSRRVSGDSKSSIADKLAAVGGVENVDEQIGMLVKLDEAGATPDSKNKFIDTIGKARTMDKIVEVWLNGLLSGPPTHVVNTMSNGIVGMLENVERGVAAAIGKLHGGDKVTLGELKARTYGMIRGSVDGVSKFKQAMIDEDAANFGKMDVRRKAISGTKGKIIRIPFRMLGAEDAFFKSVTYAAELRARAYHEAKKTGKSIDEIVANPPKEMIDNAWKAADVATFSNELGPIGKRVMQVLEDHPSLRFILPFVKTPANIVKYALKRTALAPLFQDVRTDLKAGGRARDLALARILTGSGIGATVAMYAAQGLITGQGPDDPRERQLLRMQGWMPYALKIGDTYVSYQRMEPFGILIGMAADSVELAKVMDSAEASDIAALISGSITRNLTNKTYLKGLSDFIEAINDPERYGASWAKNLGGTVVPSASAVVARTDDPYLRRAETLMEQIRSRIPGLRDKLLPKLDRAGNPINLDEPLGPDIASPIYQSVEKRDIVASEIYRLNKQGYDVPTSGVLDMIKGHKLTAEQHNAYIKHAGDGWRALENIMQRQGWDGLPDTKKAEIVSDVMRKARNLARVQTIIEYPGLLSQ